MYLLKNIHFNYGSNEVKVEDGIQVMMANKRAFVRDGYWGNSEVNFCENVDFSKMPLVDEHYYLLSYISTYSVQDIGDGFKELTTYSGTYEPEKVEGYIIFIRWIYGGIETSGEKLFGRWPSEVIVVLKEGDYIEFEGRRIEVINNKLMLVI